MSNKSNCCFAPVTVGGEGMTHYYVCSECKEPCDTVFGTRETIAKKVKEYFKIKR